MSLSDNAVRWTQHVASSRPRGRAEGRKVSALAKLRRILILVMVLADVLTLLVAMAAAYVARQSVLSVAGDLSGNVLDSALIIALGWVIAIAAFGGYDPRLVPAGTEIATSSTPARRRPATWAASCSSRASSSPAPTSSHSSCSARPCRWCGGGCTTHGPMACSANGCSSLARCRT